MSRACLLLVVLAASAPGQEPGAARSAVKRALPIVNQGAAGHAENRECFSCHQQSLPLVAFAAARKAGFSVEPGWSARQKAHTLAFAEKSRESYLSNKGTGGQVDTAGHILLGLAAAGHGPDATTDAIVDYLLKRQTPEGRWNCSSKRPPSEASPVTTTWLASEGLRVYGKARARETGQAIDKALAWLRGVKPADTEDLAFRVMGLRSCGECPLGLEQPVADLLAAQNPDGGWGQLRGKPSDAYATATALVALELPGGHPAAARGLAHLAGSQKADGSWHVVSRSDPFQKYFETGYPHGKDQWISSTAAAWAIVALARGGP